MGRKNASKTKTPKPASPGVFSDWNKTVQGLTTLATGAIIVGVLAGLAIGRPALQARAAEIKTDRLNVVFDWPPGLGIGGKDATGGLFDNEIKQRLMGIAQSCLTADTFDAASLQKAQVALQKTGWFASGVSVRRDKEGIVRVQGQWRIPFAVVRSKYGDQWVTFRGESLDKVFAPDTSGLCVVMGVRSEPPAAPGEVWPGGEVQAAMSLLQYIRHTPGFEQVIGVDTSEFLNRNRRLLTIATKYNSRILWGGPVDQPLPGEEPSAVKLKHLSNLVASTGRIDAQRSFIDIRFKDVLVDTQAAGSDTAQR